MNAKQLNKIAKERLTIINDDYYEDLINEFINLSNEGKFEFNVREYRDNNHTICKFFNGEEYSRLSNYLQSKGFMLSWDHSDNGRTFTRPTISRISWLNV